MYAVNIKIKELSLQINENPHLKFVIRTQKWHISKDKEILFKSFDSFAVDLQFSFHLQLEDPSFIIQVILMRQPNKSSKLIGKTQIILTEHGLNQETEIQSKLDQCILPNAEIHVILSYQKQENDSINLQNDSMEDVQTLELIEKVEGKARQIEHIKNRSAWLKEQMQQLKSANTNKQMQLNAQIRKAQEYSTEMAAKINSISTETNSIIDHRVAQTKKLAQILNLLDEYGDQQLCNKVFQFIGKEAAI